VFHDGKREERRLLTMVVRGKATNCGEKRGNKGRKGRKGLKVLISYNTTNDIFNLHIPNENCEIKVTYAICNS
jgi:hypothetical protein